MSVLTEASRAALLQALSTVLDPNTGQPFLTVQQLKEQLKDINANPAKINLEVTLGYPAQSQWASMEQLLIQAMQPFGFQHSAIHFKTQIIAHTAQRGLALLPNVKNVIAIASGKGGVGKSTTTVNLGLALASEGARVGILDADIYGPSQPMMLGLMGTQPDSPDGKTMIPLKNHGVQVNSIGFLVEADSPMIWRGPMATQALDQLLHQTSWEELDYLLIDMPPGTGDIQLSLSQRVPLTGAVIVTTPQDIALLDAQRGLRMFEKVNVPILGLIENMAVFHCPQCGHEEHLFGHNGGTHMAQQYDVELLGSLPLTKQIREQTDAGQPTVISDPHGSTAMLYKSIARKIAVKISQLHKDYSSKFPSITISRAT